MAKVCMVAAHKADLEAAKSYGLKTAYIDRAEEESNHSDTRTAAYIDFVIDSIGELSDKIT